MKPTCMLKMANKALLLLFLIQVVFSEARGSFLLTVASEPRLRMLLSYMLNENEFLSPFGIRSLSKVCDVLANIIVWPQ